MIGLLSLLACAYAIDVNDELGLRLDGGEHVDGWFVRYVADELTVHVPALGESVHVPLSVVAAVHVNGDPLSLDAFQAELEVWHENWSMWLKNSPSAPPPAVVAMTSVVLAGSGHALMNDWKNAPGMMVADALGMGILAWELTHQQRLNVVAGSITVSLIMKLYGATNGARKARSLRNKRDPERAR